MPFAWRVLDEACNNDDTTAASLEGHAYPVAWALVIRSVKTLDQSPTAEATDAKPMLSPITAAMKASTPNCEYIRRPVPA